MQLGKSQIGAESFDPGSDPVKIQDLANYFAKAQELSQSGDLKAANDLYRSIITALDTVSHLLPSDPTEDSQVQLSDCLWSLANNLYALDQIEDSIPFFRRLVELQERKLGPEDGLLITPLLRLAIALKRSGEAAESETIFERSMLLAKSVDKHKLPKNDTDQSKSAEHCPLSIEIGPTEDALEADTLLVTKSLSESSLELPLAGVSPKTDLNQSGAEHDLLKHLFSDNAPAQLREKIDLDANQMSSEDGSNNHNQIHQEQFQGVDLFQQNYNQFQDRNPTATRLSASDLAALGAIPSPDAIKTMFGEAVFSDASARAKAVEFLKTNDSSDEPIKVAYTVRNFDAQQAAPFLVRNKWLGPLAAFIAVVLVGAFFAKLYSDKIGKSVPTRDVLATGAKAPIATYVSSDEKITLQTYENARADYTEADTTHRAKYYFLQGDLTDLFAVLPGLYSNTDIWLLRVDDGLKFADGTTLFSAESPLAAIVRQISALTEKVQEFYQQNHTYPINFEQFQASLGSLTYINPVTKRADAAKFFATYCSNLDTAVAKMSNKTESGERWINESKIAPGEIHCSSLIYEDPTGAAAVDSQGQASTIDGGVAKYFYMRAGDGQGQFIAASKPGKTFYVMLSDGQHSTLAGNNPDKLGSKTYDFRKSRILIAHDLTEQSFFLFLGTAVPVLIFLTMACAWVMQNGFGQHKDSKSQANKAVVMRLLIVSSALLSIWLLICFLG
jgi:tetratricopeptide (TPR) repeat protein